jgi:O-methyltransferase involved in polyketide biosynthesis
MALRQQLIPETERNKFISKSVFDRSWFKDIEERQSKVFFMTAGVFVYFNEEEIKSLFIDMIREFPGSEIIFEIYSNLFLWLRNRMIANSKHSVASRFYWGINSAKAIAKWSDKIHIIDEFPYYSRINLEDYWNKKSLSSIKVMNFFKAMKMVQLKFG